MRRTWLAVVCLLPMLAVLGVAQPPAAPNPPAPPGAPSATPITAATPADDEQTLKDAKVGVDGPGLLAYFQQHTTAPDQQERIGALIRQLGDDSYKVREKASADLAKLGAAAVPYLRRAQNDADEEIKERAENLTKNAEGVENRAAQSAAAARLIRRRAPDGAAAALLAYAPDADSDAVEDEIVAALAVLGVHDGKVDAAVVAALKDKAPGRRGAAGVVVGRSGTAEQRADVQKLLTDADPRVRFRAAQGLLAGRDRGAVPALIALVKDGPPDLAYQADELLSCAVGAHAPHVPYGYDAQSRQNCRAAWAAWAQKNAKQVDLSHAEVDLPPFNPVLRARDVVRQCFTSLIVGDLPGFKRTTDAPFHMFGEPTHNKREELDGVFNENPMGVRGQPFYPLLVGMAPLSEFGKGNPGQPAQPADVGFVNGYKPGELVLFVVQQQQVGAVESDRPLAGQPVPGPTRRRPPARHRDQSEPSGRQL